ncbi:MAG: glycosyltransferase, partial [Methanoregula sp.]|nr:glycosyltransferase [Methanoregula sp.]
KIDEKTIVLGFHQRVDDGICGEHALKAWKLVEDLTDKKILFLILGGSEKYKKIAKELGLNVIFLPVSTDSVFVSKFLNTLDIYTHSGKVGETLGLAIQEAMMYKLPVVAMRGKYNGHVDVIGDTSPVPGDIEGYTELLAKLINDDIFRMNVSEKSFERAKKLFSVDSMKQYFENLFIEQYQNYCAENKKDFAILPTTIYNHLNFRTITYRILYRFPRLLNFVLSLRNKLLIFIHKFAYGSR